MTLSLPVRNKPYPKYKDSGLKWLGENIERGKKVECQYVMDVQKVPNIHTATDVNNQYPNGRTRCPLN